MKHVIVVNSRTKGDETDDADGLVGGSREQGRTTWHRPYSHFRADYRIPHLISAIGFVSQGM